MKKLKIKIRSKLIGYTLGVIAALLLCLTGCSSKSENEDKANEIIPEVEQLDENGQAITENTEDSLTKDYYEDMTNAELKELAAEALTEKGYDPKLAENRIMTFGVNFDIPDGFLLDQERENMWVTKRYPIEASNIIYAELEPDYTLQLMDEEYFKRILTDDFLSSYNKDIAVDITEFEAIEIDGIPAFRICAEYDVNDTHISHLLIAINGSKTYVIIYTQTDEYNRTEIFEESAASISVKK